jgi:hypothetical protein
MSLKSWLYFDRRIEKFIIMVNSVNISYIGFGIISDISRNINFKVSVYKRPEKYVSNKKSRKKPLKNYL